MANDIASHDGSEDKPHQGSNEFHLHEEDAISRWNQQLGLHEASIKVYSKLPFLVQLVHADPKLLDGEARELKVVARTSFFRFDQLPPEVRNMIYANVLDGPPIKIVLNNVVGQPLDDAKACVKRNTVFTSGKTTAIFLVNKAMSIEARAWFYSSRLFEFQNSAACKRLLDTMGINRVQLRYITISKVTMSAEAPFATLLWLLKDTKKLERLKLMTDDAQNLMRAMLGCSRHADLGKNTHLMLPFSQFVAQLDNVRNAPDEAEHIVTLDYSGYRKITGNEWIFGWCKEEMMKQVKAEVEKQRLD